MSKFLQTVLGSILVAALAACGNTEDQAITTPDTPVIPAEKIVPPTPAPVKYRDTLSLSLATDKYRTQVGKLEGSKLVSDGRAGYLLFGPYAPIQAGTYTMSMKGSADSLPAGAKVVIDVASGKGKVIHGSLPANVTGPLPSFDVTLPENVTDLEVRIQVSKDAKVAVESYALIKKS